MNYYSFHLGDYAVHTIHLSDDEDLAYRRLIDLYYQTEKPITLDVERAARLIRKPTQVAIVESVLNEFFQKTEDGYANKRCDIEIAKYQAKAGRAIAANNRRWEGHNLKSDLKSDLKSAPNQEPITNNQEPSKPKPKDIVLVEKPTMTLVEVSPVDKLECQHQKVIEIFHSKLPELPRVMVWNDTRRRTLSSLWANVVKTQKFKTSKEVLEYFTNYFDFIGQSDFLCGRAKTVNDRKPFIADLEWVIRPSNFAKIVEGKYHA